MNNNIYSVEYITSYIKNMFSQDLMLRSIYVKGEVSNLKYHSSNHIYFTLKDKSGTLACVMFAGYRINGLKFRLEEGQQIIHAGHPVLRWMAGNVVIETDAAENIKVTKAKSKEKIDGIVASIMALDRCLRNEGEPQGSVYDERGLLVF